MAFATTEAARVWHRNGLGQQDARELLLGAGWIPLAKLGNAEHFVRAGRRIVLTPRQPEYGDGPDFILEYGIIVMDSIGDEHPFRVEAL